jgi:multidrug efflux pump subunit AcrB
MWSRVSSPSPLENAIAQANGIDYITSKSSNSLSTITVNLRLNYDYNRAVTEIQSKISSVLNRLPPQSQQPSLQVQGRSGRLLDVYRLSAARCCSPIRSPTT